MQYDMNKPIVMKLAAQNLFSRHKIQVYPNAVQAIAVSGATRKTLWLLGEDKPITVRPATHDEASDILSCFEQRVAKPLEVVTRKCIVLIDPNAIRVIRPPRLALTAKSVIELLDGKKIVSTMPARALNTTLDSTRQLLKWQCRRAP